MCHRSKYRKKGESYRMKKRFLVHIILLSICLFISNSSFCQKEKNKYVTREVKKSNFDTIAVKKSEFQFAFKNLNKVPYYQNREELVLISKYEKSRDYDKLLPVLERYVQNFGIENFSKDTELMWRLGNLYELKDQKEQAKYLYRLCLKNHAGKNYKHILKLYETQTTLEQDNYVPLEYYYELVEYRRLIDTLRPPKSVFLNMGELVNDARFPDYGPAMNVHDDFLIFTKRKKELNSTKLAYRENEDLYFARNYDGFWDEAQPFSNVINSHCNEGSACLSRDGKTLYFARCMVAEYQYDCRDCMGSCDLYVSYLQDDSIWSVPRNLGANVNSIYWDSQPTLSHSEDTLFFASDRKGGLGLSDIYFTYKLPGGGWAPAQNMGPTINTRGNEVSPFYHPTHHVFYFSSNGHFVNFGNFDSTEHIYRTFDIYKTRKLQNKWQEPKNIGPLVNGKGDEYYFTIDSKSKDLFYARSEEDKVGNLDLFSFPLPMEAQPTATTILRGSLTDSATGAPFKGIVSVIDLDKGIEVSPKYIRPDGSFEFDLIDHNDYLLILQGDDFFRIEQKFTMDGDTTIHIKTHPIQYNRWTFEHLEFENGKSDILPDMEFDLDKVVNFLLDHPYFKLKISGHTDSQGDAGANLRLSQKRADAIKEYIEKKGYIDGARIEAVGYGNQRPIVEEKTDEDRSLNRRVEFQIIKPTKEEIEELEYEEQLELQRQLKEQQQELNIQESE
jgi:hypothetical protein